MSAITVIRHTGGRDWCAQVIAVGTRGDDCRFQVYHVIPHSGQTFLYSAEAYTSEAAAIAAFDQYREEVAA